MSEEISAWHWMGEDRTLRYPPHPLLVPGTTFHAESPLELYANGMHGSRMALDGLRCARGFIVARTLHSGEIVSGHGILCSRTLTACWMMDARMVVLDWLAAIVDHCLTRERTAGREPDPRAWNVVATLRRYVLDEASLTDVRNATYAAAYAANDADAAYVAAAHIAYASAAAANTAYATASATASTARAAAYAARAAAYANVTDATANAANAAANTAYAARAAVRATHIAEWEWMNAELESRLLAAHAQE